MIPIPQYHLYSASIVEFNMEQVGYYLDEINDWGLNVADLEQAIKEARTRCNVRGIVVINPGNNPTGMARYLVHSDGDRSGKIFDRSYRIA